MTKQLSHHSRGRRLAGLAAAAAVVAAGALIPTAATAAPAHAAASGTKTGPVTAAYVEVNNADLANVGRYTLSSGANAFDIAIIFAANINYDGTQAQLYFNPQVQQTLTDAATEIQPLQAKGIKVELSILGNHEGAGISNFTTQAAAAAFAQQLSNAVSQYGLDGIDLDDEYADYGTNGTPQTNNQSVGWLISALRADMPNKLITLYDIGPAATAIASGSSSIGSQLNYAWNPYYGTYSVPDVPGLTAAQLSPAAVDIQNTSQATADSLAKESNRNGYGAFMTYNLPNGDDSAYVSSLTQALYGQTASYK